MTDLSTDGFKKKANPLLTQCQSTPHNTARDIDYFFARPKCIPFGGNGDYSVSNVYNIIHNIYDGTHSYCSVNIKDDDAIYSIPLDAGNHIHVQILGQ